MKNATHKFSFISFSLAASIILGGCSGGTDSATPVDLGSGDTSAVVDGGTATTPYGTDTPTNDSQASAVLVWTSPSTNTDGSSLTDLQSYNIYKGTAPSNLSRVATVNANQTNYTAANLTIGTYYFAVSAVSASGSESSLSNVAGKTVTN